MSRAPWICCLAWLVCCLAWLAGSGLAAAETVYLTRDEALKLLFRGSQVVLSEQKVLTEGQATDLKRDLGYSLAKREWTFYIGKTGARVDGYALIDHQIGKTEPITFVTAISPEGRVRQVELLVYRESIGSEVKERGFLKQYEGKGNDDSFRLGKEITNITGATLSSRAVTVGVKRTLRLWRLFYGK